jgi:nicotinamidase/pyrazinamidase
MAEMIFWDVDTQVDFIEPNGRLYVSGSEAIIPNLARLTDHARRTGIQIVADICDHTEDDDEISDHPDFKSTFPPHCLRGTPGQEKIAATRCLAPLWIENRPYPLAVLRRQVGTHRGEIVLKKNHVNIFTQPNANLLLEILQPRRIVVYGVALDVCVYHAVEGFLSRGDLQVAVVRDAVRAIDAPRGDALLRNWRERGVAVVGTAETVSQ